MSAREEYIAVVFNEFLARFSAPRAIQGNQKAMQQDANSMLATILRFAPGAGYTGWMDGMLIRLGDNMITRSWPAPGELTKACKAEAFIRQDTTKDGIAESAAILRMINWFNKFRGQMPGHGNPARTQALIQQGVLENERVAKFHGFDLSDEQGCRAESQEMGLAESQTHIRVMAKLGGVSETEAETLLNVQSN